MKQPSRSSGPPPSRLPLFAPVGLGVGLALCLAVLTPRLGRASIVLALDLPRLVQEADHIAVVDVTSVHAAWDERHERIYSTIELNVVETWKAAAAEAASPDHLTIIQAGGTVGDIRMTVMGLGTFVPGERSLVFLRGPANHAQLVGMTQGKRSMRYESSSRHWLVAPPDLRQIKLVSPALAVPRSTPLAPARQPTNGPGDLKSSSASSPSAGLQSKQPSSPYPGSLAARELPLRDLPFDDVRSEIQRLLGAGRP